MELRVNLKVCEACGSLWYRAQNHGSVYCSRCEAKLKDFPTPETRRRPGRQGRKTAFKVRSAAAITGRAR